MTGTCIIGQSGGPTAVINASLYGAVKAALDSPKITRVLGAHHGIAGVLSDDLYDLGKEDVAELELLPFTPSSALGSCRYKLKDPDSDPKEFEKLLAIFKKYDVRYFFYIGGNDSMDTCEKVSRYFSKVSYDCRVMGIPKTIDNDLNGTDHCPGYGSAAKFIATSMLEVYKDCRVYDKRTITVVEIMGRNAGWLTAASALASKFGEGPDLIYLPETPFEMNAFLERAADEYEAQGGLLVAVSEGIRGKSGKLAIEAEAESGDGFVDSFGHVQLGGVASLLAAKLQKCTDAKVRAIELSLLQRCAAHCASKTDIDEALLAGSVAVNAAVNGETGKMVAFECTREGGYTSKTKLIPLTLSANAEKPVPAEWITDGGITDGFIDYALPLIQGEPDRPLVNSLPRFTNLKRVKA
ncbi:MAG: 6-phosphofructokinase [Oscillospiraceae bacterium]|jgi:6-phosphofructokinase 1|nr:6-phosphofructokinase [Oscillospiraceae bacterium]